MINNINHDYNLIYSYENGYNDNYNQYNKDYADGVQAADNSINNKKLPSDNSDKAKGYQNGYNSVYDDYKEGQNNGYDDAKAGKSPQNNDNQSSSFDNKKVKLRQTNITNSIDKRIKKNTVIYSRKPIYLYNKTTFKK